jgi:Sec-independent protein secretion pathway component TatC
MLNLEETLSISYYYNIQKDLYLKGILYVIGAITFLDLLRSQISEINLLQLVPGYYLLLVLISFVLLMTTSIFSFRIPFNLDSRNGFGTKTMIRMDSFIQFKLSLFLFFGFIFLSLNIIIPIGLDSFDSYDQETLTNLWSFDEVLNLESVLLAVLLTLSQIPIIVITRLSNEKDINKLPEYWKNLSFFSFVFAGFVTPTIDGYTQINLSFSAISLYLIVITLIEKRVYIKFNSTSALNF